VFSRYKAKYYTVEENRFITFLSFSEGKGLQNKVFYEENIVLRFRPLFTIILSTKINPTN